MKVQIISNSVKLSNFKFKLPDERIALHPTAERDEARLMVLHKDTGKIEHKTFSDITKYFGDGDVMVFNDTKVVPSRLYGNKEKTGARIEVLLIRELNQSMRLWDVLVDPARKIRIGNKLYFGPDDSLVAEVIDNTTSRGRTLRFLWDGDHEEFRQTLFALGEAPLPRDVRAFRQAEPCDIEDFQTIFAKHEGGVTVPVTGLHFSKVLMKKMEVKGIGQAFVTLHAGLGNFRTIDVEDLSKHKTDSEEMIVGAEACELVNKAKEAGKKVCAVGSTTMRCLETAAGHSGLLKEFSGWTNKFIYPPYNFKIADAFVCNFQHPLSPMLMMQCSFADYHIVMNAYDEALKKKYNFGTYGDALLIL